MAAAFWVGVCDSGCILVCCAASGTLAANKRVRALWEVGDAASSQCPFKMPKISTTGVAAQDRDKELNRVAFISIMEHLWNNEDDVYACRSFLDERKSEKNDGVDQNDIFKVCTTLGKLGEDWVVQQLLDRTSLTKTGLKRAEKFDEQSVQHLFAYILSAALSMKLPAECRSKTVMDQLVVERVEKIGRCTGVSDDMILPTGQVNWLAKGCYKLTWAADKSRCVEIAHTSSKASATIPEHVLITQQYTLTNNHSDMQAMLSLSHNSYTLAQFFGASEGPMSFGCWFGRSRLVQQAAAQAHSYIEHIRKQACAGTVATDKSIFEEVRQERKQAAASKARTKLLEHRRR